MLLDKELDFLIKRHKNKITLGNLLDLYKVKYPNVSYVRVAKQLYKDLKIKYEPDYKNIDGVFMRNPEVNKDYGFNSYFIPSGENFLKAEFKKDNGRSVASALFFLVYELSNDSIDNIEQNIHSTADDYLGAFSDIFLDVNQLRIKYNIPVLDDYNKLAENNLLKEEVVLRVSEEIKACNKVIKSTTAENEVLKAENTLLKAKIAELNEQLRAMQEVDNGGKVATLSEYEGELPPKTDADKLADFIELVFNPDLLDNGKIPTYSRLHTKLTAKYRDRKITAKNTIKKYLNQF